MNTFSVLDSIIFIVYVLLIVVIGLWCSRTRKGGVKRLEGIFPGREYIALVGDRSFRHSVQYIGRAVLSACPDPALPSDWESLPMSS